MKFVPPERILPCTNCGMAPMRWDIAFAKLEALGAGAARRAGASRRAEHGALGAASRLGASR